MPEIPSTSDERPTDSAEATADENAGKSDGSRTDGKKERRGEEYRGEEPPTDPRSYSIGPLLKRSHIDSDGHLEVSIYVEGTGSLDDIDLDVFLKRPRIDPGERIELGIFVSGCDSVAEETITVFHDHDDVLDLTDPGTVRRNRVGSDRTAEPTEARSADKPNLVGTKDTTAPETVASSSTLFQYGAETDDRELRQKPLDGNSRDDPAYILEFNTRASATPGRYRLPVVLTYRSEAGIKQEKHVQTVRVNNWRKRWEPWVTRGVLLGGVLSVCSVVYGGGSVPIPGALGVGL
ncbi:hypothetical protein [Natrialba taiwanensis]|uniref:DUF8164 domain-containing protein n=1 Tax=Natrialba taiwanensis DSM 12281 TaxID=1230458 RepID=L9ZS42_9EURY|nr:hypothetical protein [Natrialba taiwanensis]ELY88382.1 hypothetical protein C484_15752 [Natrialba taiwanensis DSM 12281]